MKSWEPAWDQDLKPTPLPLNILYFVSVHCVSEYHSACIPGLCCVCLHRTGPGKVTHQCPAQSFSHFCIQIKEYIYRMHPNSHIQIANARTISNSKFRLMYRYREFLSDSFTLPNPIVSLGFFVSKIHFELYRYVPEITWVKTYHIWKTASERKWFDFRKIPITFSILYKISRDLSGMNIPTFSQCFENKHKQTNKQTNKEEAKREEKWGLCSCWNNRMVLFCNKRQWNACPVCCINRRYTVTVMCWVKS